MAAHRKSDRRRAYFSRLRTFIRFKQSLTFCDASSEKPEPMKRYTLSLLGIFVAMAFLASCQQEGTTDTTEPATGTTTYVSRPEPPPREANQISFDSSR